MVKIEKNIPIPAKNGECRESYASILMRMAEGDSVLLSNSSAQYMWDIGRKQGRKMVTRKEGDKRRVWYVGRK
jgi:hypothetical protein